MKFKNVAIVVGLFVSVLFTQSLFAKNAEDYRQAAEQGDENSQIGLAICYHIGDGVEKDQVEAAKWLRKAAEKQGNAKAQWLLGSWYTAGTSVEKDPIEAQKWFRKAAEQFRKEAEQGNAYAQYRLGNLYNDGCGVTQDKDEAAKWWRKAAEQGNEYAIKALKKLE
jgi:TPR repeat protein